MKKPNIGVNNNDRAAVALKYDGKTVPKVVAKGKGHVARKIIEAAEQSGVPLQSDTELTRLLSSIPLGNEIPRELFAAVAEVIAFAYMLSDEV